ncbi:MAG: hypothetical protein IJR52_06250 [Selenomonadaceae bacterium]|nr:hypothetical protein [Selenomonadaceae bacterium]MBQ9497160.1 hypothetical protein [Selenomonadaceae bacterium]
MSQKGFATFFGLILILAVALCAKSIQESETNYSYAAADYQAEFELQNAAVGGIYEAAEKIRDAKEKSGTELLPLNYIPTRNNRPNYQIELVNRTTNYSDEKHRLKKIHVTVWGERLDGDQKFRTYNVKYSPRKLVSLKENGKEVLKSGYILFSVAESSNGRMDGKIYRSAFAYVLSDEDDKKIYFMGPTERS